MSAIANTKVHRAASRDHHPSTWRMPIIVGAVIALVGALAIGVVASRNNASAPTVANAQSLAGVVSQKGLGCNDFKAVAAPAQSGAQAGDLGQCSAGSQQLDIAVFANAKARDQGLLARLKGCIARRAFNTHSGITFNYLVGPNWLVASSDVATLTNVNAGLHAELRKSPC